MGDEQRTGFGRPRTRGRAPTVTQRRFGRLRACARRGAPILAPVFASCADSPSVLRAAGPAAERIASLWWMLLALGAAIYLIFAGLTACALFRRRRPAENERSEGESMRWILIGGALIPAMIVAGIFTLTLGTLRALAPPAEPANTVIEVNGKRWWWEVRYLGADGQPLALTANEIHIPAGESVELRLQSDNVIHSFWVPQLHGKLDLVPGKTNVLRLQADRPGIYRGQCAEYCGVQHTLMAFLVIAEARPEFDAWLAQQRTPAPETLLLRGRAAFEHHCGSCHTVRGTRAAGADGPDLTHLAGRRTIAAATLPNTRANLSGWIIQAQSIKPGSLMPNVPLEPDELQDIVDYLMALR
jgi:cytochrome c oxidase subunit 2